MEVFTEKEEQAQQLTGRCPSLLEATIEELIILLDAEPIGRRKSKGWQESSVMPLCIAHITTAYSAFIAAEFEKVRNLAAENGTTHLPFLLLLPPNSNAMDKYNTQ